MSDPVPAPSDHSSSTPSPEVGTLPTQGPQPTLEDLIKAAGPLATAYFESQERMQKRALAFDEKSLASDGHHKRTILIVVTVLSLGIMGLATLLILRDKTDTARDIITLIVSMAAAAFGGYGLGKSSGDTDNSGG